MADIRGASLGAHAAARVAKANDAACFAARAAGQAVATTHVPQHAFGAAYYALKVLAATDREQAEVVVGAEREQQAEQLPERLRQEVLKRAVINTRTTGVFISVIKHEDF